MKSIKRHQPLALGQASRGVEVKSSKNPFFFTGTLYLIASVCQLGWLWILFQYFDQIKRWTIGAPIMGWAMNLIFLGIIVMVPLLFVIGIRLILLIKKAVAVSLTSDHIRKRKMVNMLLIIGIIADLFFSSLFIFGEIKDRSAVPFMVALLGGRVLKANFEAVALYFSVRSKKEKPSKEVIKAGTI